MKKIYFISFFCILALFFGGFLIGYCNHHKELQKKEQQMVIPDKEHEVRTQQTVVTTNCDTEWCVQKYDKQSKTMTTEYLKIPAQYIGTTREQLQQMLKEYQNAPILSEEKEGLTSVSLVSFSRERVTILKTYDLTKYEGFYLFNRGDEVVVFLADQKTLFFETGIELEQLPEEIRAQIINGKYFEKEKELYSFLESYTS